MDTNFERIRRVFLEIVQKPAARWDTLLTEACDTDEDLHRQVAMLLEAHARENGILDRNGAGLAPTGVLELGERPGAVIGPYKLLRQIGEGGMGVVWMAEQTEPVRRTVALKVIKPGMDSRQVVARFEAERQALAMMDHLNIARVFDGGTTESGRPYFVMELVHGVPITRYCDDVQLTPRQRLELFVPVCQAIQHAHQKGIIHRDIKASNVLITLCDGKPVPKVIDFGVAKATEQKLTERTLCTQSGTLVGTLEYMSPEQAEMSPQGVDTRSDIYSLGVLLYELLTGGTPLSREQVKEAGYAAILYSIREKEPPRPSVRLRESGSALAAIAAQRHLEPARLVKLVRGELDWIVMKCLEKDRNRRYETANGLARDVQRYLHDETVLACPPSAWYRFRKFARRNKARLLVAACLFLAVAGVAVGIGWAMADRTARSRAAEDKAGDILKDADELLHQGRWQDALAAVERAQAALASVPGTATQAPVADLLTELHLVRQLDETGARLTDSFDHATTDRNYARLFADFGIDVNGLSPPEIAARIREHPKTAVQLAAALDNWAIIRRDHDLSKKEKDRDPAAWQRLLEAARLADPDPWRSQLRQLMGREDRNALRKLADSAHMSALPAQSLRLMGTALIFGGDAAACIGWLRKAHRQHPGDVSISFDLSFHLSQLKPPPLLEVLQYAEAAVAASPNSWRLHNTIGNTLRECGRYEEAVAAFSKVIELDPDSTLAWRERGFTYMKMGQHDKAIEDLSEAIKRNPNLWWTWDLRGLCYGAIGHNDKALADLNEAVQLQSNQHTRIDRGRIYRNLHQYDKAFADFTKAIELGSKNADEFNTLAWLIATCPDPKLRDGKKAVALAEKAVEWAPKWEYYNTLGAAYCCAEKWKEAVTALTQSMKRRNGTDSFDLFFLAMAHWQLGNKAVAHNAYSAAVQWMDKNQPGNPELRRFREQAGALLGVTGK
jgi:serine/threonine protein kinase/tetratricopeptide (TPR) repeat protein